MDIDFPRVSRFLEQVVPTFRRAQTSAVSIWLFNNDESSRVTLATIHQDAASARVTKANDLTLEPDAVFLINMVHGTCTIVICFLILASIAKVDGKCCTLLVLYSSLFDRLNPLYCIYVERIVRTIVFLF